MQAVTLIIDKRRELSIKYKKILENKNNKVLISKNLIGAMKIIQDKEPDLIIISDSVEGDLSDYCKKIRALTYNMRPIIIATSKSAELQDRLEVLENGADDFISEPVNSDEFLMRIKAHLRRELASDKLIQTYCAIINSALSESDYLGALSENKFLIITDSIKAEKIANYLTFAFDSVANKFYSPQDIRRGFMLMHGDEFAGRRSNFVHTTIGIVTNEFLKYQDSSQLLGALMQIHKLADMPTKSNYLAERPRISAENSVSNEVNKRIFIVEDDEAMTILLTTILDLQGYEVSVVKSYDEILKNIPALIILDAGSIDALKGIELCKKIRQNSDFDKTKLIVTSILHDKELILTAGADLYIPKPYEISNLIKWVEKLLNG